MGTVFENPALRDRTGVFADRRDAGRKTGEYLSTHLPLRDPVVAAIPAGGVPVGFEIARILGVPLTVAVVRKIAIPWNTEAGFGAVAWDGIVRIDPAVYPRLGLTREETGRAVAATLANVQERVRKFDGGRIGEIVSGKTVIITDDGLASGSTMEAAVRAAHRLICLNIRSGSSFAVADAYREWHDLSDGEVLRFLKEA
jgi:putative phosphoribosyl transferase